MKTENTATFIFQAATKDVSRIREVVGEYASGAVQVLVPFPHRSSDADERDDGDAGLARQIAEAIQPRGKQTMRRDALRAALGNYDSCIDQEGEIDNGMRVALAALSKALRPFAQHLESPMDLIAFREREYFDGGRYRGTTYTCTPLGEKVRNELKRLDAI